mgnify:FL=1
MSRTIKIRKGADIRLVGAAENTLKESTAGSVYAIKPTDFHGLIPKLLLKEGAEVKKGTPLFHDKHNPAIVFTSPVSGEVAEIVRGAKRKILEIRVLADTSNASEVITKPSSMSSKEEVTNSLMSSGLWPFIRQRPFSTIAKPSDTPKAIFVSTFSSAPLAPDADFVMQGQEASFKAGLSALSALSSGGKVELGVSS